MILDNRYNCRNEKWLCRMAGLLAEQSPAVRDSGQLLAVIDGGGKPVEQYVYDPAGNILEKTVNGKATTFTYDAANQLVNSTADGKTTDYRYDAAGRLVQEGGKSYNYGYLDKILNVLENGQQIAQFDYHVNGQIASAMYGDKKESFLWDGLALIQRDTTTLINEPAITGGNPIMSGGNPIFEDMLGTSLGTAANGQFQANELTAFGEPMNASGDNFFTGKPYIGELGYAFLFRNYRPDQGKWQTQDPLGYPDGWNNFAYVNNWVTDCIDWLGGKIITPFMTATEREKFNNAINELKQDPKAKELIEKLENSNLTHNVAAGYEGIGLWDSVAPIGSDKTVPRSSDVTITYNPDNWKDGNYTATFNEVILHELSHALQAQEARFGERTSDPNHPDFWNRETDACKVVNQYLADTGSDKRRTEYNGRALPNDVHNMPTQPKPE